MFINPFKKAFGLDIGDRSIKIVQLKHRQLRQGYFTYELAHASSFSLPEGLIENGEIIKPEEVLRLLKSHLEHKNINIKYCPWAVTSLPETKTFIHLVDIQLSEPKERINDNDVYNVIPSYLPYEAHEIYLDWQEINPSSQTLDHSVLLASVPKKIADAYTYLLNIAGIRPLALEVEALPITRAVINRQKDLTTQSRGILDLGATRSSFIIYDHESIQFSLSLPMSGANITEHIQKKLSLTWEEAEKIKKECGFNKNKCPRELTEALNEITDELAKQISQAIQFYKIHFPNKNPLTGIRLCGGGANLFGLESSLSAKLKIKIKKANPWVNIYPKGKEPMSEEESISYTTAVGLALRAIENPINL
ncbi:MAG TPA: type IV pilus assembly protein PilM [Candidatus Magasanikbacteria bacterium]|nr:type IV pilus assembly protein PilM [Candidatus Magasanikbacteria bacterium]